MASMLKISLLGVFHLVYGETPMTTTIVSRLHTLLAYLILHSCAALIRQHAAFTFWPDSTGVQAHTNLRNALYRIYYGTSF
jgi:DNA-binding SARP family transcriptional activator